MGTRADFYIGRGQNAKWLGSTAWDGYPDGISPKGDTWPDGALFDAKTEDEFTARLEQYFAGREDVTRPEQGWPWPWNTSHTTDYAYAFDGDRVWAACFGHAWFDPHEDEPDTGDEKVCEFPDMTERMNVQFEGSRSGLIVLTSQR